MSWFHTLTGFSEEHPAQVREQVYLNGDRLASRMNGKSYLVGRLAGITGGDNGPMAGAMRQRGDRNIVFPFYDNNSNTNSFTPV